MIGNSEDDGAGQRTGSGVAGWVILAVAVALVIFVRVRLIQMPLERDEGEYAYAGQLMLAGVAPYRLAYNMKFPGTYAAYALIMAIFGQSIAGIRVGILLVNLGAIGLMFLIGRKLFARSVAAGAIAAAMFAMLTMQAYGLGMMGHATHFVAVMALGGIYVLMGDGWRMWRALGAAILMGLAVVMKQPGAVFVLFGAGQVAVWIWKDRKAGVITRASPIWEIVIYGIGAATPVLVMCGLLYRAGVFPEFWFWTIKYAKAYGSEMSVAEGLAALRYGIERVTGNVELIWTLAGAGAVVMLARKEMRARAAFVLCLLFAGMIAASAGFYFREHYFILIYPAVSLLAAGGIESFERWMDARHGQVQAMRVAVVAICAIVLLVGQRRFLLFESADQASRDMYGFNPFVEAPAVGKYIEEHSAPTDRILVLGSEPEVYFYARRKSATGFIYMYPLLEAQAYASKMQRDMAAEAEKAQPEFVVVFKVPASWLVRKQSDLFIQRWMKETLASGFDVVGVVNPGEEKSEYFWDDAARNAIASEEGIVVFRRERAH